MIHARYPHWLTVTKPGAGGVRDGDGQWVESPSTTVYDNKADVQDRGAVLKRDTAGTPVLTSDAVAFLWNGDAIDSIKPGMPVSIRWEKGKTGDAEVVQVERMSHAVYLRFV